MAVDLSTADLSWSRPICVGDVPAPRSGHSFTIIGSNAFLFGGCDNAEPAGPSADLYVLKVGSGEFEWSVPETTGDAPPARWRHTATVWEKNKIVIFGGFASSTNRFNDVWVLDTVDLSWSAPLPPQVEFTPRGDHSASAESSGTAPAPRGAHSASLLNGALYVFGGYGGMGYGRRDFNDLHALSLEEMSWSRVSARGKPPEPRSGHTACVVDSSIYVFGGWNHVTQFSDLHILDVEAMTWSGVDSSWGPPRWNHTACSVEAIPHWKLFIFGGCTGDLSESKRASGTYSNEMVVLETGKNTWSTPDIIGEPPSARGDLQMVYDAKGSRLMMFGGWANRWFGDVYVLDVGSVVGPPYAIMGLEPEMGPITGKTMVHISGVEFPNTLAVVVRFATRRGVADVPGVWVSDSLLTCQTPDFSELGPGAVDVRVSLRGDSFTTTVQKFTFFAVTDAARSLAFGPGLLSGGAPNTATVFIIQAKDTSGAPRISGGDEFTVTVRAEATGSYVADVKVQDLGNGNYVVTYTPPQPGAYTVAAVFEGTFEGKAGHIRGSPFRVDFPEGAPKENNKMGGPVMLDAVRADLAQLSAFTTATAEGMRARPREDDLDALIKIKEHLFNVVSQADSVALTIDRTRAILDYLKTERVAVARMEDNLEASVRRWEEVQRQAPATKTTIAPMVKVHGSKTRGELTEYVEGVAAYEADFRAAPFWAGADDSAAAAAAAALEEAASAHEDAAALLREKAHLADMFEMKEVVAPAEEAMARVGSDIEALRALWATAARVQQAFAAIRDTRWSDVEQEETEDRVKALRVEVAKSIPRAVHGCEAYAALDTQVKNFQRSLPLLFQLRSTSMRPRHWRKLQADMGADFTSPVEDPNLKLDALLQLGLQAYAEEVEEVTEKAAKEETIERNLAKLQDVWVGDGGKREEGAVGEGVRFVVEMYNGTDVPLLRMREEDVEALEADQVMVLNMLSNRFVTEFEEAVATWKNQLGMISDVMLMLGEIQRIWSYLEPLFMRSDEVMPELPEEGARFQKIDVDVKAILREADATGNVLAACNKDRLLGRLKQVEEQLEMCKKALTDFLDSKRGVFPRFYFVAEATLLDIVSNGSTPLHVLHHITKVLLATDTLVLEDADAPRLRATGWVSRVGTEVVAMAAPLTLEGRVEGYMQKLLEAQRESLVAALAASLARYPTQNRVDWLMDRSAEPPAGVVPTRAMMDGSSGSGGGSGGHDDGEGGAAGGDGSEEEAPLSAAAAAGVAEGSKLPTDPAQIALLVAGIQHAQEVEAAFEALSKGNREALKQYMETVRHQLVDLIRLTRSELAGGDRQKVMVMITMDAHNRDVLDRLISEGVASADAFQWQSQLKQRALGDGRPVVTVADATLDYGFEYLGNGSRLVVTPLTDRIYVTATQALHLQMGCAPAGPAGTGKTETTKDLAAAVGKPCYVVNCSPEMNYQTMGDIFKGLASSGAWGCFDEFNRLIPEVLSVCSVQYKAVLDGIRAGAESFFMEDDEVRLDATCGVFITMNPGYLGRSTLPEGLKALFRPITVMVPDLVLICENMLMAEGFENAKALASKFYGLYSLLGQLLSKQAHYDWGLRAVKSVLVVAGQFKRAEPDVAEDSILLRTLRDFNVPKIVAADEVVFFGLLRDLFPGLDPGRKRDDRLEQAVRDAAVDAGLWPDDNFILKAVQLQETLAVRHCVFIMGPPGAGKSETWRTLAAARERLGERVTVRDLNPKAVSTEELYGFIHPASREWRDGLLSHTMRDMAEAAGTSPKWILLDGDLDANWIESMNSVMDDNRMLTLASNERIPLLPHMRMLFEIRDLRFATPATVSRAGVLYISTDGGSQWSSLVAAWVQRRPDAPIVKEALQGLFDKYVGPTLDDMRTETWAPLVPQEPLTLVATLLQLLEGLLSRADLLKPFNGGGGDDDDDDADDDGAAGGAAGPDVREVTRALEPAFVFAAVWAFGSATAERDGVQHRDDFSEYWRRKWKTVRFPGHGRETVFDFYLDASVNKFESWKSSRFFHSVEYTPGVPMSSITVPTAETVAVTYWVKRLVKDGAAALIVGDAGCGKTNLVQGLLAQLAPRDFTHATLQFNYYTSAASLQASLEAKLDRKTGSNYGPPGSKRMVFFLDDLNLPALDDYNTQSAVALVRQHLDYRHWYDRSKQMLKHVMDCQYLAAMNPTSGSFAINPRLQRHFAVFALGFPGSTSLLTIYQTFLDGHLSSAGFAPEVAGLSSTVLAGALSLHQSVVHAFRKTALNFHYEFTIRHLSSIFEGLLMSRPAVFAEPAAFVQLWLHESERVYMDRLVSVADQTKYRALAAHHAKKRFPMYNMAKFFTSEHADPLVFAHFADKVGAPAASLSGGIGGGDDDDDVVYGQIKTMAELEAVLLGMQDAFNDDPSASDELHLTLFEDALKHVCRITRVLNCEGGHALLVGVGGSGKQSLTRLAAYVSGFATRQIAVNAAYTEAAFREDLVKMHMEAGLKNGVVFLLTDSQVADERFLVYINDLLSSGQVAGLFSPEQEDEIVSKLTPRCRAKELPQDRASVLAYFAATVRRRLHVVLCFSPVGDAFRTRARRFPALVSCTTIDWFHPWPASALLKVARSKLEALTGFGSDDVLAGVEAFLPFCFDSVNREAETFLATERRAVYTTPKSYLELLELYISMRRAKDEEIGGDISRLASGVQKLKDTAESVSELEDSIKALLEEATVKSREAEAFAAKVESERAIVEAEEAKAAEEAERTGKMQAEVDEQRRDAEADLAKAEPMLVAAEEALGGVDPRELKLARTIKQPPKGLNDVFAAVMVLLAGLDENIAVHKSGKVKDTSWKEAQRVLLRDINELVERLRNFKTAVDDFAVPPVNWREVRQYLELPHFTRESIEKKNSAVAGLCDWVINIVAYYDVIVTIEPKRKALREATETLEEANAALAAVTARVEELQAKLKGLKEEYDAARASQQAAEDTVARNKLKLDLAQRLTRALSDENVRWKESIDALTQQRKALVGDTLLAAAFVSYAGPFTAESRQRLLMGQWLPFLRKPAGTGVPIPLSASPDPVAVLTGSAEIARWQQQLLPADRVSTENAVIVTASKRWPLLIDPQLQGIAWLRELERERESELEVLRLTDGDRLMERLRFAMDRGSSVVIENMSESVDAALWPLIQQAKIKRHGKTQIRLGGEMVEFNRRFRLYLHTKLANPHYPPEMQAECTLVNFTVTPGGLEDQLLAMTVSKERPDLAAQRVKLISQQNAFRIRLKDLEDDILEALATADGDVTENVELITKLEDSKALSRDISEKVERAAATSAEIERTSEKYRAIATRGSLLFFLMNSLPKVHVWYSFSLNAFVVMFLRAIELASQDAGSRPATGAGRFRAAARRVITTQRFTWNADMLLEGRRPPADLDPLAAAVEDSVTDLDEGAGMTDDELAARCDKLIDSVTRVLYDYLRRSLFDSDKLIVSAQLALQAGQLAGSLPDAEVTTLLTRPLAAEPGERGHLAEWLPEVAYAALKALEDALPDRFPGLVDDVAADSDDWAVWFSSPQPETLPPPGSWAELTELPRLLLLRALRPDRLPAGLSALVGNVLGPSFVADPGFSLTSVLAEASPSTPLLFYLFPGVDPTAAIEAEAAKADVALSNLSMGQGQEALAEKQLRRAAEMGGWVVLQNVHLMTAWLPTLERTLEQAAEGAHEEFRCFLTAEPPPSPRTNNLPESLVKSCIKIANEAPSDLRSNLKRAWSSFNQARIDACTRPAPFKGCLFTLSFFHALVLGRKRFGAAGWSRPYSFSMGDLAICADVLQNQVDRAAGDSLPWEDLRYMFGEIMYGGHVTDPWDRRVTRTYLAGLFKAGLLDGAQLAPGFALPPPAELTWADYDAHIDNELPAEGPLLFGLHPNAEIGALATQGNTLCRTVISMQGGVRSNLLAALRASAARVAAIAAAAAAAAEAAADEDGRRPSVAAATAAAAAAASSPAAAGGEAEESKADGGDGEHEDAAAAAASAASARDEQVRAVLRSLLDELPEEFSMAALDSKAEPLLVGESAPYIVVCLQECRRMNVLLAEVRRSLDELLKGLDGQMNMTEAMDSLATALARNDVPGRNPEDRASWEQLAWPSTKPLASWFADLKLRVAQLLAWSSADGMAVPASLWLPGLFNPMAFLTAVMQTTSRRKGLALDHMTIETHVTLMRDASEVSSYPEEGAYIHGLYMQGARWATKLRDDEYDPEAPEVTEYDVSGVACCGHIEDGRLKETMPAMPVMFVRAVEVQKEWQPSSVGYLRGDPALYEAPVYTTTQRGGTFVFLATLSSKHAVDKWTLAGVSLIMQTDE